MGDILDFKHKKCAAKFRLKGKRTEVVEEDSPKSFGQRLGSENFWASLLVSAVLVFLIIATVPSVAGIVASCIAASVILLYMTGRNGRPAYCEVIMLLVWAAGAFALNSVYPLDNLKTPLGALLSGLMIASLFYMYKTSTKDKDQEMQS